ncbi:MAG TPA: MFS transporter [Bacteroidota bacterium]|nr:MFS transporter [Bacteroidota bacterium]
MTPDPQASSAEAGIRRSVFLASTLSSFLTPFMGSSVNVALPAIGRDLSLDAVLMSWIATAYLLAAAIGLIPAGRIADLRGRKKVFLTGMSVYTAGSLLCGLATTSTQMIAFRIVQGLGGAMMFGTSMAIVTSVFPREERGKILGYTVSAVYLGLSLGPFVGGLLTDHLGWRSVFLINVPLGIAVIAYSLFAMKGEWLGKEGGDFDVAGSLLYGLSLLGVMYGFSHITDAYGGAFVAAGIVLLAVFIWWEYRSASPVLNLRLVAKNRVFGLSNLAAFINYAATAGVTFLMSLYLQYVKGFDAKTAGVILVAQPAIMALLSPFAGRLSDRVEPRIVASAGMALTTIGLVLLAFLTEATPTEAVVGALVILGAGFGLFSSPNTNAVMSSVAPDEYGTASAFSGTMRLVGQVFSMGIVTLLLAAQIGAAAFGPAERGSLMQVQRTAFALFALMGLAGIFASLVRGNVRK